MGKQKDVNYVVNYVVNSAEDLVVRGQLNSIGSDVDYIKRKLKLLSFVTICYILYQTKILNKITDRVKESEKGEQ